jgi:hypothetical protein
MSIKALRHSIESTGLCDIEITVPRHMRKTCDTQTDKESSTALQDLEIWRLLVILVGLHLQRSVGGMHDRLVICGVFWRPVWPVVISPSAHAAHQPLAGRRACEAWSDTGRIYKLKRINSTASRPYVTAERALLPCQTLCCCT